MTKYHVNIDTGQVYPCTAQNLEKCKYYNKDQGFSAPHFDTEIEARSYVERENSKKFNHLSTIVKTNETEKSNEIYSFKNTNNELNELISKSRGEKVNEFFKDGVKFVEFAEDPEYSYAALTESTGIIKPELLNEDSYKDFGFKGIKAFRLPYSQDLYHFDISDIEMDLHNSDDQLAIFDFTDHGFSDFNNLLFRRKDFSSDPKKFKEDYQNFKNDIEAIDRILDNSPKVNKILYRGLRSNSPVLLNVPGKNKNEKILNYLNKFHTIGNVVEYAGYQSTSTDPTMAKNFASSGILFEIMTPEGANIKAISKYPAESEVLTPRNSRYMVVGNQKFRENGKNFYIVQMVAINENNEILNGSNSDVKPSFDEVVEKPVTYGLPWN